MHGDTSTTFVTALACFYLQIPVGHVEAGLRTYNIYSPCYRCAENDCAGEIYSSGIVVGSRQQIDFDYCHRR